MTWIHPSIDAEILEDVLVITPQLPSLRTKQLSRHCDPSWHRCSKETTAPGLCVDLEFVNHLSQAGDRPAAGSSLPARVGRRGLPSAETHARIVALLDQVRLTMLVDCYPTLDEAVLAAWACQSGRMLRLGAKRRVRSAGEFRCPIEPAVTPRAVDDSENRGVHVGPTAWELLQDDHFKVFVIQYLVVFFITFSFWASGCNGSSGMKKEVCPVPGEHAGRPRPCGGGGRGFRGRRLLRQARSQRLAPGRVAAHRVPRVLGHPLDGEPQAG